MEPLPETSEARTLERSGSLVIATRRLLATLWEHAGIRLELLALEFAEERARLVGILVAIAGIVVCLAMALAFAGLVALIAAWDTPNRLLVAAVCAAGFGLAGIASWLALRHMLGQTSPIFRHSLAEWRRDVDALRPRIEPEA